MPSLSPARRVAFDVLLRVESGAYASDLLRSESESLDPRDAGLAAQIVFGVLRRQSQLDFVLASLLPRPKLDLEVRIALRMGVFQFLHLDRVPPHAVVSDAVELVKRARKRSATGLVNAILRKAPKSEPAYPDECLRSSTPPWLLARWVHRFGEAKAAAVAAASLTEPPSYVHSLSPPLLPHEPTDIPNCYRLFSHPTGLRTQDIGSQWIVTLLNRSNPEFPTTLLDLCSAPGGKTRLAIEAGFHVTACDRHLHRLREMKDLGCPLIALDATHPLPFRSKFDRILVDAPCSGTGTLARNPEIKWRLQPSDLSDLHARQVRILTNALACLAPHGQLVYSTCSLEPEENEAVLQAVLGRIPEETHYRLPGIQPGDGFFAAVIRSD